MAKRKARGHGKPDLRKGAAQRRTQSKYNGNNDTCPVCGLTYGNYKTGVSYFEVWMLFWTPKDAPESEWKYTTRGVILGKWFELKQEGWAQHLSHCEEQSEFEERECVESIPLDSLDLSDVPF